MKQYTLTYEGLKLDVEFDQGPFFWYRARLIVNDEPVDERAVFWGTTRLRTSSPRAVVVDVRTGFFGPKTPVLRGDSQSIRFDKSSCHLRGEYHVQRELDAPRTARADAHSRFQARRGLGS